MRQAADQLHIRACVLTGRTERFMFHERAWFELLRVYDGNAAELGDDLEVMVRYLKKMIGQGKRNPGALKLRNMLAVDRWDEDLAEARIAMKGKVSHRAKDIKAEPSAEPATTPEAGKQVAAGLREFLQKGLKSSAD